MAALPTATLPRLGSLVRLFGSPVDGEALGSVRALGRVLKANGATFHDLAERIEHEPAPVVVYRDREPSRATWHQIPAWASLDRAGRMAWMAAGRSSDALSDWERSFAASLYGQLQALRQPSAKQGAVADGILAKLWNNGVRP